MGACSAKKSNKNKLPTCQTLNTKEFDSFDFSTSQPKGINESFAIAEQNIYDFYKFENFIGSGGFGAVRVATMKSNPEQKYAVKSILKEKIKDKLFILRKELECLKELDHPNIIKFHEIYQDKINFHIVMEYCSGGEILSRIIESPNQLDEQQIKEIFKKLLSALNYMHSKSICHRDLKPQNILFLNSTSNAEPKIIDFGLSSEFEQSTIFQQKVGTLMYVAPEVLLGNYDASCDRWSLGIIFYILLTGEIPYIFSTQEELSKKIKHGSIDYISTAWRNLPNGAKELVKGLLQIDTSKRWQIEQCFQNQWLMKTTSNSQTELQNTRQILKKMYNNFYAESRFKKEILKLMVGEAEQNQLEELQVAFRSIDKNNQGRISFETLQNIVKSVGLDSNDEQIEQLFRKMHIENQDLTPKSQTIDYSEFIGLALACKKQISKGKLYKLFKQFTGNKEYFDNEDLKNFFARKGRKMQKDTMVQMMQEVKISEDGTVNFDQFLTMMQGEYIEKTTKASKNKVVNKTSSQIQCKVSSFSDYVELFEKQASQSTLKHPRKKKKKKSKKHSHTITHINA